MSMNSAISPGSVVGSFLTMETVEQHDDRIVYQAYDTTTDTPVTLVQLVGKQDAAALLQRAKDIASAASEPVRLLEEEGIIALVYGLPAAAEEATPPQSVPAVPRTFRRMLKPAKTATPPTFKPKAKQKRKQTQQKHYRLPVAVVVLLLGGLCWALRNRQEAVPAPPPAPERPTVPKLPPSVRHPKPSLSTEPAGNTPPRQNGDRKPAPTKEALLQRFNNLVQRDKLRSATASIEHDASEMVATAYDRLCEMTCNAETWKTAAEAEIDRCSVFFNDWKKQITKMYEIALGQVTQEEPNSTDTISTEEWEAFRTEFSKELEEEREAAIRDAVEQHADRLKEKVQQRLDDIKSTDADDTAEDEEDDDTASSAAEAEAELLSQTEDILESLENTKDDIIDMLESATDSNAGVWNKKVDQAKSRWSKAVKTAKKKLKEEERRVEESSLPETEKKAVIRKLSKHGNDGIKKLSIQLAQDVKRLENSHHEYLREERSSRSPAPTNFPFRRPTFRRL